VAEPALIRNLDTGQVAYIYRGGVTYIQVKRLLAAPPALAHAPAPAHEPPGSPVPATVQAGPAQTAAGPDLTAEPAQPDAGALLDEAFGPEPG
jgi:hypothetical protein